MKTLRNRVPHLVTVVLLMLGVMTAMTAPSQAAAQKAAAGATVCSNSPIPAGWVITSSYRSSGCPGTGVAYTIADSAGQNAITVCSFSPIPAGWVVTSSYSSAGCAGSGVAYSIGNMAAAKYATVCSFSPIPAGWVVTSSYSSAGCAGSGVAY
ncbi:hypothetical protein ACFWAR_29830, partial [Streptomyces sp. NPDC059917]|uniref:hypothetical protein n=1 Tax=Streptomyces sp. NPDC059917 TaxID=3347002 RepID=UPI00364C9B94